MRKTWMLVPLAALIPLGACSSKVKNALDPALKNRIDTVKDCFPGLYDKLQALLEVAESWRVNTSGAIPDPPGLTWNEETDGSVTVQLVVAACTANMVIRFYSPTGVQQDLDLSLATSLSEAIDLAATELRDLFGTADKFMVGAWTLTGPTVVGMGALTGIIGGTTNQNELEELRTTTATPNNGPPPVDNGMVTVTDAAICDLTFNTASLQTDTVVDQQYPIGTVNLTIAGPDATVTATITFDNTVIATIVVTDVPGSFAYNLDTGDLTHNG